MSTGLPPDVPPHAPPPEASPDARDGEDGPVLHTLPDDGDTRRPGPVAVEVCALTDVGRTREHNEDAYLVADLSLDEPLSFTDAGVGVGIPVSIAREVTSGDPGVLFLVADGLGGAAAGEIASRMAARAVFDAMRARLPEARASAADLATALRDAAHAANAAIHQYATSHAEVRGMGTTLTAAALYRDALYLAQVGDSRAYLVRGGVARQLTKDQSLMQKLVEAGEITPEQAETSARRNIILQALGPEPVVKVDLTHQTLRRGDVLLLCSDGLSGQVRAPELSEAVEAASDLSALCRELVARANATGGPDNITVVAARFDGEGLLPCTDADEVGHRRFPIGTPTPDASLLVVRGAEPSARPAPPPAAAAGVTPGELAERQDRARVMYVGLAIVAVVLAALLAWRLLAPSTPSVPPAAAGDPTAAGLPR